MLVSVGYYLGLARSARQQQHQGLMQGLSGAARVFFVSMDTTYLLATVFPLTFIYISGSVAVFYALVLAG